MHLAQLFGRIEAKGLEISVNYYLSVYEGNNFILYTFHMNYES